MKRYIRSSDSGTNKNLNQSLSKFIEDVAYELYEDLGEPGDQADFVNRIVYDKNVEGYQILLASAIQDAIDKVSAGL